MLPPCCVQTPTLAQRTPIYLTANGAKHLYRSFGHTLAETDPAVKLKSSTLLIAYLEKYKRAGSWPGWKNIFQVLQKSACVQERRLIA